MTRALLGLLFVAASACASAPHGATGLSPATSAVVIIHANVSDASVWIDDRLVGDVADVPGGVRLRAGKHRLELRHDGHATIYQELTLSAGETRTLDLTMMETFD